MHFAKSNKPISKGYMVPFILKSKMDRKQIIGCPELLVNGRRGLTTRGQGMFEGDLATLNVEH